MAEGYRQSIENGIKNFNLAETNGSNNEENNGKLSEEHKKSIEKYNLDLNELYKLALNFYKEKEGKAVNFSYQNKLKLVAFIQQVSHGKVNADNLPPLGVLDVIGRDRRDAWYSLGDINKQTAMFRFVELLDDSCSMFGTFIEAHKRDKEEREQIKVLEEDRRKQELVRRDLLLKEEENRKIAEEEKRQIQEALNQQTYHQFKTYSEQQYPGNPEQQGVLVRQLQEQHYHQYMQQLLQQQNQSVQTTTSVSDDDCDDTNNHQPEQQPLEDDVLAGSDVETTDDNLPSIAPPAMWTRQDIKDFKESIRKEGGDAIIKVGHGETVTVRVPTHEDGTCLFWEFATDNYDIGFGVYFEWTKSTTNQVSVHIQESEDEDGDYDEDDLDEDEEYQEYPGQGERVSSLDDPERGRVKLLEDKDRPLTSAIVPIYRRDCQDEVYAGSHPYPGQGVYLLKFDNSYSLWRSKTLYYRVYYTR